MSCVYHRNHETAETCEIAGSDALRAELADVRMGEPTDEAAADYDDIFAFTLSDRRSVTFAFNQHNFALNGRHYAVSSDEALWTLAEELARNAE